MNLDGEGDSNFFTGIVGFLSILPIALPVGIKVYVKLFGDMEMRMMVKDSEWE